MSAAGINHPINFVRYKAACVKSSRGKCGLPHAYCGLLEAQPTTVGQAWAFMAAFLEKPPCISPECVCLCKPQ